MAKAQPHGWVSVLRLGPQDTTSLPDLYPSQQDLRQQCTSVIVAQEERVALPNAAFVDSLPLLLCDAKAYH